jgi:tRNA pseudouridine55 synthase
MNEILLIDKPKDWTSFDVVAKIRGVYTKKEGKKVKVGHAGTLDPFATGLLIVLLGQATKDQDSYMKQDKEYEATLRLGKTSTTGDPEGEIKEVSELVPDIKDIERVLSEFVGEISQTPPAFSAIKVDGKRAYKLAREGKEVKIEPRKVTIYSIELLSYEYPNLKILVKCSSGTYIRTLGEDIGGSLKCGAYLTDLRRTAIGEYKVSDARPIDFFI